MNVEEIMTHDVITVTPETTVHKAARLMVEHGVSGLPVVDQAGTLVGVSPERGRTGRARHHGACDRGLPRRGRSSRGQARPAVRLWHLNSGGVR